MPECMQYAVSWYSFWMGTHFKFLTLKRIQMQTRIKWTVKVEKWYGNKGEEEEKNFSLKRWIVWSLKWQKRILDYVWMEVNLLCCLQVCSSWIVVDSFHGVPVQCATGKGELCGYSIVQIVKWNIFRIGSNDVECSDFEHKTFSTNWALSTNFYFHFHYYWLNIGFCVFHLKKLTLWSHENIFPHNNWFSD